MSRAALEVHAAACRVAIREGRERPRWWGDCLIGTSLRRAVLTAADLTGADLTGADLSGADLSGAVLSGAVLTGADLTAADLTGADLTGVRLSEGTATGLATGGHAGGYRWWAVALETGDVVLQYGCERHILGWWLAQGPELSESHGHQPEHWAEGPMVAIAAAETLGQALPPGVRR